MIELCEADPRVVLLDGDLANSTKADKLAGAHPERFFMMGIAEQNLAGVAAGLASVGLKPWVASFAAFLATRDLDQVRVVVAQPGLNVKFAAHYSGIQTGFTGKTHQVVNDISIMRSLPQMTVVAPCDGAEARQAMIALNALDGPAYLRLQRDPTESLPQEGGTGFRIGHARVLHRGNDVALISTGGQTLRALRAAHELADLGISAAVLHISTIKPIDVEAVVSTASSARCVLTCEEHSVLGGLGGAVAEILAERNPMRMARLGLQDVDGESGPNEALLKKYGLSEAHVVRAALELVRSL